jgi:predicted DNA-binding transcriptional regulator YafY
MGRRWLQEAMREWQRDAPVKLIVTRAMAERLQEDWYYRYAEYDTLPDGRVEMQFGADRREFVFELVRWLGPGAELRAPEEWRAALRAELQEMVESYL